METYVVLFRGINVGGKNLLSMKDLKVAFEEYGCLEVKTYIQSGNVVLKAENLSSIDVAELVSEKFGLKPEVFVLCRAEFLAAVRLNPFHSEDGKSVHLYFCSNRPKVNTDKLEKYRNKSEYFQLKNQVFYLYAPEGVGRSRLVANIESCLGVPVTGRNLNTIRKLEEMAI